MSEPTDEFDAPEGEVCLTFDSPAAPTAAQGFDAAPTPDAQDAPAAPDAEPTPDAPPTEEALAPAESVFTDGSTR